ncbi:MAG TPA: SseB family protein [Holophagaceae bacterium]|nr:SseB family protein [Holophagaceae bacterium]
MTTPLPSSPLEVLILEAQTAKLSQEAFLAKLVDSKVFVLLEKSVDAGSAWDNANSPMVLNSPSEFPVVAVFSSQECALPAQSHSPNHPYAVEVEFKHLLRGVQPGLGLVMNPGFAIGFEIAPADLQALKRAAGV